MDVKKKQARGSSRLDCMGEKSVRERAPNKNNHLIMVVWLLLM